MDGEYPYDAKGRIEALTAGTLNRRSGGSPCQYSPPSSSPYDVSVRTTSLLKLSGTYFLQSRSRLASQFGQQMHFSLPSNWMLPLVQFHR